MKRVSVGGAAHLVLADGVVPLHPQDAVFAAMLTGWERRQRARGLAVSTIRPRMDLVRRFAAFTGTPPWEWLPGDVEDWATELLSSPGPLARSTVRGYLNQIALFCGYLTVLRLPHRRPLRVGGAVRGVLRDAPGADLSRGQRAVPLLAL